jgi:hypothetical protein
MRGGDDTVQSAIAAIMIKEKLNNYNIEEQIYKIVSEQPNRRYEIVNGVGKKYVFYSPDSLGYEKLLYVYNKSLPDAQFLLYTHSDGPRFTPLVR